MNILYLLGATILFSLSFGLIRQQLTGLPADLVSSLRLLLACIVFIPFFRRIGWKKQVAAVGIGAIQFGVMYVCFIRAFHFLQGNEVALLTTTTPILVILLFSFLRETPFRFTYLLCALLSMGGSCIIVWNESNIANFLKGILLVQVANLSFAVGQVLWRRMISTYSTQVMASAYFGGAVVASLFALFSISHFPEQITVGQWFSIGYLGIVPTAIGFWLWNKGAACVGRSTLAVMNDLKIPISVLLALLLFHETIQLGRFSIGCVFIVSAIIWGHFLDKNN